MFIHALFSNLEVKLEEDGSKKLIKTSVIHTRKRVYGLDKKIVKSVEPWCSILEKYSRYGAYSEKLTYGKLSRNAVCPV
jgi:hypothetical protein